MEVVIDYAPRRWAENLHAAVTRWIILVLHRRAGKTTAVLNHLQRDCLRIRESQFGFIAPTYKQAKRIAWDIAKKMARDIPGVQFNESDLIIRYPNGSKLFLAGSDNPDSLRGIALWGVGFDEYPQQPSNIFSEIISKCLADHLGYAIFFGTPKGKNEFYRILQNAQGNKEWTVIVRTIDDSLRDEQGETIDNLRVALEDDRKLVEQGLMTEDEFQQEWYCSFDASVKGAYYAREIRAARENGRIKVVPYDTALKVHTVWDLGVGKNLAVGFYQGTMNERRMIDYWEGDPTDGLQQAALMLQDKKYVYGKHFAPHDIHAKEITTGKTRLDTAREFGIHFEVVPSVSVDAGIEKGRLFWSKLWVDEKNCALWIDAISQYRQAWDDKRGCFIETPVHDWTSHPGDVHRYAALVENLMSNEIFARPTYTQQNKAIR